MDLDTNVKKFKYSAVKKFICLALCFVSFLLSVNIAVKTLAAFCYFDGSAYYQKSEDFTDSSIFVNDLTCDVNSVISALNDKNYKKEIYANFEAEKAQAVKSIFDRFDEAYHTAYANDYMDYSISLSYEFPEYSRRFDVQYYEILDHFPALNGDWKEGFDYIENNSDSIIAFISEKYDRFADYETDSYESFAYRQRLMDSTSLRLYARCSDYDTNDLDGFNYEPVTANLAKQYPYYFLYNDGKVESKGLSRKAVDMLEESCNGVEELYLYFNFEQYKGFDTTDIIINERYDKYFAYRELYANALDYNIDVKQNAVIAAALAVVSVTFGIMYLTVAGKKSRDEKAKLAFIDYLPIELHLIASVLIGWAAAWFSFTIINDITEFSMLSLYIILVLAGVIWLLVVELLSSIIRSFRSDRKWYKFSLLFSLITGTLWLFRRLKMLARNSKIRKKVRSFIDLILTKSGNFKRNLIIIALAYFVINALLVFFAVIFLWCRIGLLVIYFAMLFIAFNTFVLYHTVRYISQLDCIITSAREHKELNGELDKLYNSLRLLAESMKYTNTELQNAVAKAVRDERLKTELITNVSHDLKTPLTSIISYVDLLSKCDINDEKAQKYIEVLDKKGAKLKRLIDDLIEASKVTSGNITINATRLNLKELCMQAVGESQSEFEKAELEIVVKKIDNPPIIFADGQKAYRVFENLLSNARKYSARASRVYVSTYMEGNMGVFEIKNMSAQPLDISPDELTERFVRGDKSRNQDGNGLGLSIAKELCRAQGGNLEITIDGDLFKVKAKLPLA